MIHWKITLNWIVAVIGVMAALLWFRSAPVKVPVNPPPQDEGGGFAAQLPDAYLIDVSSPRDPQLYVVENEISSHDLFKHIGVQLLQFSVSFAQAGVRPAFSQPAH